jgi:hypothetical protein
MLEFIQLPQKQNQKLGGEGESLGAKKEQEMLERVQYVLHYG